MSAPELIAFTQPDELMNPVSARGKALYGEEAAKNGRTLSDLDALLAGVLGKLSAMTAVTILTALAGIALLLFRRQNKRLVVSVLLLGALLQAATLIVSVYLMPEDVGFVSGLAPLFVAMGFSVFAAFFAGFLDYEELPKKYKLFLMMLPFLVAVFLFSYLPLSGWRYAFYNYKLGLPMDQQEYVGFKWFTSLWSNSAQLSETIRVLRNTFAMSGLGLATSWLPVAFAIFLTEIRTGWFKKFVQIFTTLPNFISWVLVFSFALTSFSLDTGIVNKALLKLGFISEPIAYLNSSSHIWVKMWLWNTWKTLGWSAIMYLAAIAGIDQELYEAAKVDGAGRWRQIVHITIPGILPTFFVLLLLQISNIVNNAMEQYLVFQNAMNKSTIEVLDLYVYNISLGTRSTNTISMATAIGILKSLVSIVLLFLANNFSKAVRGESIV
jgi:putative aldouronate transport system permease protein